MKNPFDETPLTITRLEVENVKRLRSVRVTPEGAAVVIGGRNAQGKSSLLDAIEMAIGGGSTIPAEPIRRGERSARIVADLGELVVERTFTAKGSQLVVKNADGVPQRSPQALLDTLCSKVAFDPLAFERMPAKEQARVVRELDPRTAAAISKLDGRRVAAFDERTEANRAVKAIGARLEPLVHHLHAPKDEVSVAELAQKLEDAHEQNRRMTAARSKVENAERAIESREAEIARLHEALQRANAARDQAIEERKAALAAVSELEENFPEVDTAPIQLELRSAEATNRKVRENKERRLVEEELRDAEKHADALTEEIENIDDEKLELLSKAKLPVPGLGFTDDGPTLNGLPLEQASQAERLRVSVAIGFALNPRFRVLLVRDGSRLDNEGMRLLAELAREADGQVWCERVSETGAGCSLVIEDGAVRETSEAAE